jgi:hypothetical protein
VLRYPTGCETATTAMTSLALWRAWQSACARSQPVRYAAAGGPNQVVSASGRPRWARSPTQATCPSGPINTAVAAVSAPSAGTSHTPSYFASISWTRSADGVMSTTPGLTEVEQHRPGIVQQGEDPQRAVGGDQVEIGHAAFLRGSSILRSSAIVSRSR